MTDRKIGTIVHTSIPASDPAALLPLQEALGYDLAQSLFGQERNLVFEGLTDFWYVDAVAQLLRDKGMVLLNEKIAPVPTRQRWKGCVLRHAPPRPETKGGRASRLRSAGDQAANQDVLVHALGNKCILRTKDAYDGPVKTRRLKTFYDRHSSK